MGRNFSFSTIFENESFVKYETETKMNKLVISWIDT